MLAPTDVLHFLADEFTGLSAGGLALTFIFPCSFERCFFWHDLITSFVFLCLVPRCKVQDLFRIPKWLGRTAVDAAPCDHERYLNIEAAMSGKGANGDEARSQAPGTVSRTPADTLGWSAESRLDYNPASYQSGQGRSTAGTACSRRWTDGVPGHLSICRQKRWPAESVT
jgi:hypothetical protein